MARRMVDFLIGQDIAGTTLLEIGGGVGDLQVEMLKAGLGHAVNVELSGGYEDAAAELLQSEGLVDRVDRLLGDFVETRDEIEPADIVILNRVICCYPFMDRMVTAAQLKTRQMLGVVVPQDRWPSRVAVTIGNAVNRARGCDFRAFVHDMSAIESLAGSDGMVPIYSDSRLVWRGIVFARPAS